MENEGKMMTGEELPLLLAQIRPIFVFLTL